MEVVLKTALQKDSPIYAMWMPVLYLGTENVSGLTVLHSAVGEGLGKIWTLPSFTRILKTLNSFPVIPFPLRESWLNRAASSHPPSRAGCKPSSCWRQWFVLQPQLLFSWKGTLHFCHNWGGSLPNQGKATSLFHDVYLLCGKLHFISFLPAWIDPVWSWKWRIKGLESL